ncbi:hypothetical protein [Pelagibius sp. 7325]|uniref:general secretion pathway protein GspK n=1 Tax=Pelagibius sp. 7325 TaxID=3131994 RepID=UPI0030ED82C5
MTVLWFVVLLSLAGAAFLGVARDGMDESTMLRQRARAESLAETGVSLALLLLLESAHRGALSRDGSPRTFGIGEDRVTVRVQDVAGRIDLNDADEALLRGLFLSAGLEPGRAEALAAAVLDWRDRDDEGQAEAALYRRAGLAHGPANRPFETVNELRQVVGVDTALFARVAPALTVYAWRPEVDAAYATPVVLSALRAAGAAEPRGSGETVTAADVRPRWGIVGADLPPSDTDTYAIDVDAALADGTRFRAEAVVMLTGDAARPFTVQAWAPALD